MKEETRAHPSIPAGSASSPARLELAYLDYTQSELDAFYDQRIWAPDWESQLAHFRALGEHVRSRLDYLPDVAYGPGADERLDFYPAAIRDAPIHVHIHGGGWRNLRKEDVAYMAEDFVEVGVHYVAVDFSPLPDVRLPEVVEQTCKAIDFLHRHAESFGGDPDRIYLSGHSSGAHLTAALLALGGEKGDAMREIIKGALCVSGMYDLGPVVRSSRSAYVKLDEQEVERLSPARNCASIACPISVVHGQFDNPEFVRQSRQFGNALTSAGKNAEITQLDELNHYQIMGRIAPLAASCAAFAGMWERAEPAIGER